MAKKDAPRGTCWITGAKGPTTQVRTIWGGKRQVSTQLISKAPRAPKGK